MLLRVHFLKPHLPKMCDRLRTHYPIDWALRVDVVFIMKNKTLITTKNHASMQERALNILVGKQKQCIQITHSGLIHCCEFAWIVGLHMIQ